MQPRRVLPDGDCPSFITIETEPRRLEFLWRRLERRARNRTTEPAEASPTAPVLAPAPDVLPDPEPLVRTEACNIRLTGIGGTGVVTVAQLIGTAAMLDGYEVRGLDQIGMSQKAGPVVSDLCLRSGEASFTNRVGEEQPMHSSPWTS
ncbi:MAG: 2-oxoacid:acceptor oxidoreductase family protein [Ilumatobacteraceae bacterium]